MISIVVDPRNAFGDLCNAFDGDRIVVGGDTRFNPLEITETPQRLTDEVEDLNPYSDKRRSFIGFAQTFFSESESEKGLSTLELNILREAFDETMARAGIYPTQLTTHSKPSPTIPDLKAVLWEIEQDVEGFLDREETDRTIENWEQAANRIRSAFEPFRPPVPCNEHKPAPIDDRNPDPEEYVEQDCSDCKMGGAYSNLALPSKFSIANSKFVYVDVQQTENDRTSPLMMKLVWDAIYNRVKESEHPVYTIIDEFHRILNNEGDLDWLENEYRHARHFDNAITVMSQSAADFFGHEKAERIVEMSANSLAFRTENMSDEHGEKLGFNSHEVYWINNCQAGDSDKGWANAILKAGDNDPIPLTVQALPIEERYIDRETWEYRHTDKQVEKPT
jgi:type IV secretory pathway VirB4 component